MTVALASLQVVEDILDDDQDMEDMSLGQRAAKANEQALVGARSLCVLVKTCLLLQSELFCAGSSLHMRSDQVCKLVVL